MDKQHETYKETTTILTQDRLGMSISGCASLIVHGGCWDSVTEVIMSIVLCLLMHYSTKLIGSRGNDTVNVMFYFILFYYLNLFI